ncbi:MAG: LysM peptidoglycan-binding domain-containing protein [Gammaproteobacteria bacterium]|nr:LysM peptidoglycan-binding domain-containing protein [Gammaproteobacteria bacterium]
MQKSLYKLIAALFLVFQLCCCSSTSLAPVEELHPQFSMNKTGRFYTVRPGDTLYAIAFLFDKNVDQLATLNQIRYPYALRIGQQINLSTRTVVKSPMPMRPFQANIRTYRQQTSSSGWLWPTKGQILKTNLTPVQAKGINIIGRFGQDIHASKAGVVAYAGAGLPGYGKLILIKHSNDYLSAYAFNSSILVKEGQTVSAGERIANMGQLSPGTYGLHFEVRYRGEAVRPERYLGIN